MIIRKVMDDYCDLAKVTFLKNLPLNSKPIESGDVYISAASWNKELTNTYEKYILHVWRVL
jgi:hypothetical protein